MNSRNTLTIILATSLILGRYQSFAQTAEELFPKAIQLEEVKGELEKAIEVYQTIITQFSDNRPIASKAQLHIGLCYEKLGNKEARKAYESVVLNYADQTEPTKVARERLNALSAGRGLASVSTEVAMRQIWVAGKDSPISISPDGRFIVFSTYDSGDLWLRDLQSGEQRQITRDGSAVEWSFSSGPAMISPEGKRIAYIWTVRSYGELRISALDGSFMKVLHNGQDGRRMYSCYWMPDGHQILASSFDLKDNTYRRHIISLLDGVIRDIGKPEQTQLNWGYPSPDGRYIAYGLNNDIFIYDTDTERDSVLVQNPTVDNMIGWTPDGFGILFVSDRSGTPDLYLMGIGNGKQMGAPKLLHRNLPASTNLQLTNDGRLFQIENTGTTNSYITPVDEQTGKPTGMVSIVEPNYPNAIFPGWSNDGKILYYELFKETSKEQLLFIHPEASEQAREIPLKPKLQYWYRPIMSPDGRRIAITGTGENMNFGIFSIDPETGEVTQLAKIPTENEVTDPSQNWSPDSKAIYYKLRSPEIREEYIIRRKDLMTNEEKDVYRGICTREMKISPDGNRFVYFRNDGVAKSHVLGILDLKSGKELELWRVPETDSPEIQGPTWVPDGSQVLVAKNLKLGTELWRFPTGGGQGEKLYFFPEMSWGFVMHPSGKRMTFTQSRNNYELWVLENFLPK